MSSLNSGTAGTLPLLQVNAAATATFNAAFDESRDLTFFLLSALGPVIVIVGLVLLTSIRGSLLGYLSLAGGLVALVALLKLLHDLIYDIAGFPDYKMPVWAILYSILYVIEGFTFLFFGLHLIAPGMNYVGITNGGHVTEGLIDCLYLSVARTFGVLPEGSIRPKTQVARFLPVIQSALMMFLNIVIITKFVTAF